MPALSNIETTPLARIQDYGKSQVIDDAPKVIKELRFGVLSTRDIVNQSQVELADRRIYDFDQGNGRKIAQHGPLDKRMGVSGKSDDCVTCKQPLQTCNGHFGHVRLVLPVFHVGYFKKTIQILQSICKDCSCILLSEVDRRKFLASFKRAEGDTLRQAVVVRRVADQAKKTNTCFQCGTINGLVRKAGTSSLKITHDKFKKFNASTSMKKVPPKEKIVFDESFTTARANIAELDKHLKKAMDDLNPLRVLQLFRRVQQCDLELLGLGKARPESFLWQYIPAPPVAIRPSVGQEGSTTEDDITTKLGDIIFANHSLREALEKGAPVQSIIEHWDFLSLQLGMYINGEVPGLPKGEGKTIRGLVQRLKGKQGRFRGNLSGKRVDFSGRTVISPDPNLRIDEVAVPVLVAKNMTYPEVVTRYNIEKLRENVRNGTKAWPGANYVIKTHGFRHFLRFGTPSAVADNLREGDIVERHLQDGDIVLFNRQPSLHKLSILCHFVKVRPHRTFRLNECVCNPYNADFDGDEMNLHVPQTEEARTEALQLMGVKYNLTTPKNGEPIIAAIQDFITACWLLSSLDVFYDKKNFVTICLGMLEPDTEFDLPPPSIIKPEALWTGKQVFNILIRPNKKQNIFVNLDAPSRNHGKYYPNLHRDLQDDSFLCIRNSEVMCGRMDKGTVGSGKKKSLFYTLVRDYGPDAAARSMNRLSKLCARWLSNQGFSVGISDVTPPQATVEIKNNLIRKVFTDYNQLVQDSRDGKLTRKPGMDDAGTLESEQVRVLSTVRTELASVLEQQLSRRNSPMLMATSGSKGSNLNVAQMAALLGQQDIENKRVPETFQHRTLPHFAKYERSPPSLGFVYNSFFSGLTPYEFIFHGMGGRVGLVDTAVKTAETGYMSRRLMKSLEDLSTQYDRTVRNSAMNIVQFRFGDDELDPVDMEASAKPVDFDRTYAHIEATTFDMNDVGLDYEEIHETMERILGPRRNGLPRLDSNGNKLSYDIDDDRFVDQNESARAFLKEIQDYITGKSKQFNDAKAEKEQYALPKIGSTNSLTGKRSREDDDEEQATSPKARRSGRRGAAAATVSAASKKRKVKTEKTSEPIKARAPPSTKNRFDLTCKLSKRTLEAFIRTCLEKYERARVEPAHAVGAVGAQSIGEPGTQMTLKTFHFAGVAGMNLTAGVPRIKEIINASKDISTPVITCKLERRRDLSIPASLAQIVKGRIECLYLGEITKYIQVSHSLDRPSCLYIKVSLDTISDLGLDLSIDDICEAIVKHRRLKSADVKLTLRDEDEIKLVSDGPTKPNKRSATAKTEENPPNERLLRLQNIKRLLPTIHILGHPLAARCVISAEDDPMADDIRARRAQLAEMQAKNMKPEYINSGTTSKQETPAAEASQPPEPTIKLEEPTAAETAAKALTASVPATPPKAIQMHKVMVEGYGLRFCMNTDGVDPYTTQTNSVIETLQVLGIEAARSKIITEIATVMSSLSVDPRHMALLADVMTYKGEVLGITRFGLAKMRDSVLQLASFEKTADHVFDAGIAGKTDLIEGVSECVIVGKSMGIGTGMVEVIRNLGIAEKDLTPRKATFEDAWKGAHKK